MRVEHLNEMLAEEWHRMLQREAAVQAAAAAEGAAELRHLAEERQAAAGGPHANGSIGNGRATQHPEWLPQPAPVGSTGSMASMASTASVSSIDHYWEHHDAQQAQQAVASSATNTAVYAPSAPSYGTAVGGPGSIPHAAEEHLHEVSSTGAAISLALLLQQRSEAEEASRGGSPSSSSSAAGSDAAGSQGVAGNGAAAAAAAASSSSSTSGQSKWVAASGQPEEQVRHSTAALSALAWLDPCTHGLDELIIFDAIRRKFGIGPRVEGRIRRLQSGKPVQ